MWITVDAAPKQAKYVELYLLCPSSPNVSVFFCFIQCNFSVQKQRQIHRCSYCIWLVTHTIRQHIIHFLSQKSVKTNILHVNHKTDLGIENELASAWHWQRTASESNYILILWKLQKCWPLGEFDGLQSQCIEYVLLLCTAMRLAGELSRKTVRKSLSVCSSYFCFPCLWLMCPILEESIFLTKEEPAFPADIGYSCIRFIFCCKGLPGFTSHLLREGWGY